MAITFANGKCHSALYATIKLKYCTVYNKNKQVCQVVNVKHSSYYGETSVDLLPKLKPLFFQAIKKFGIYVCYVYMCV